MASYLADTTIWTWAKRAAPLRHKLYERVAGGEVATCVPVALEYLHGARNGLEYDQDLADLKSLEWLPIRPSAAERALEVQRALAHTTHGAHRIPAVDYLVAAVAETTGPGVVLWHADRELARVCDFIGHPHEHERVPRR